MKNKINILVISSLLLSLIGVTTQAIHWRLQFKQVMALCEESQAQTKKAFSIVEEWKAIFEIAELKKFVDTNLAKAGGAHIYGDPVQEFADVWIDGGAISAAGTNDIFRLGSVLTTINGLCVISDSKSTNQYWFSKPMILTNSWDITNGVWIPLVGDRIETDYLPGPPTIHTVTNVVKDATAKKTGWMIYCDGLPGLDAWWVRAPDLRSR
jgi:hypothetical protein